jgi:hypothetical protein
MQGITGSVDHREAQHCAGQFRVSYDDPVGQDLIVIGLSPGKQFLQDL